VHLAFAPGELADVGIKNSLFYNSSRVPLPSATHFCWWWCLSWWVDPDFIPERSPSKTSSWFGQLIFHWF